MEESWSICHILLSNFNDINWLEGRILIRKSNRPCSTVLKILKSHPIYTTFVSPELDDETTVW
jgi:hypothetical protein